MDEHFSPEISQKLMFYVYRLVDPRNGETFYVGKGVGNRVFQHSSGVAETDLFDEKIERIRSIQLAGLKVINIIHRHGLSEVEALEVEAAVIDAYPGITNVISGHGSSEFGVMHASEVIRKYSAEEAEFQHKVLMIIINRSGSVEDLYEATRYAWRINIKKARQAEVILSIHLGIIVGAFIAEKWLPATKEYFPMYPPVSNRYGFVGKPANNEISKNYLGKKMPEIYRKKGAANPIRYNF